MPFRDGRGGDFRVKEEPFEPYPEIADLGTAEFSAAHMQLIRWSTILQINCDSSPFNCDDTKRQKLDVERQLDRQSRAIRVRPALRDVIHLDSDHMPGELLAKGGVRPVKKLKWAGGSDWRKYEQIEEIAQKHESEKKEDEDGEEEEEVVGEDEGEFSDDGDYGQGEYVDDDEDEINLPDEDGDDFGVY